MDKIQFPSTNKGHITFQQKYTYMKADFVSLTISSSLLLTRAKVKEKLASSRMKLELRVIDHELRTSLESSKVVSSSKKETCFICL